MSLCLTAWQLQGATGETASSWKCSPWSWVLPDFAGSVCRRRLPKTCDKATLPPWEDAPLAGSQLQPITIIPNRAGISSLNKCPPSLSWLCPLSCSHTACAPGHWQIHLSWQRNFVFGVYLCNVWNPKSSTGISAPSCYNSDNGNRSSSRVVSTQWVLSTPGHSTPLQVPVTPHPRGGLLAHPMGLSLQCHLPDTPASPDPAGLLALANGGQTLAPLGSAAPPSPPPL